MVRAAYCFESAASRVEMVVDGDEDEVEGVVVSMGGE